MEAELTKDLKEALEGVDPLEFLLADPSLLGVAKEVWNQDGGDDGRLENAKAAETPLKDKKCAEADDDNSSKNCSEAIIKPSGGCSGNYLSYMSGSDQCIKTRSKKCLQKKQRKKKMEGASCVACNQPARGYHYYGAVVCDSCRAFFARAVKNNMHEKYLCLKGRLTNACQIDSQSWVACQKCRFDMCIKVGMIIPEGKSAKSIAMINVSKNYPDQETMAVFKVKCEEERLRQWYGKILMQKTKWLLEPEGIWTENENLAMQELITNHSKLSYVSLTNLLRSDIDIFKATMELHYEGKCYPLNTQKKLEDYMKFSTASNHIGLQDFPTGKLKPKDVTRLVQGNFPLAAEYVNAYLLNKKRGIKEEMELYLQTILSESGGDPEFQSTIQGIHSKVKIIIVDVTANSVL